MKEKLLWRLLSLSLGLTGQPVSTKETQRSLSTGIRTYENIYAQTPAFDPVFPETEERTLQPRFDYLWYYPSRDYESCWHFFHPTTAAFAVTHAQKYNRHHPVIYEVQV